MDVRSLVTRYDQVTSESHGAYVTIITALFMVWMFMVYLIRFVIRYTFNGPFGPDDYALTAATVTPAPAFTGQDIVANSCICRFSALHKERRSSLKCIKG